MLQVKQRSLYGYLIVAGSTIILAAGMGGYNSFGVFFDPVLKEFGWTRAATSGAFSLCLLLTGLIGMIAGTLNDRFGPRVLLTAAGVLLGSSFILMSRIQHMWELYLYYGVMVGTGMGVTYVPLISTVARWFTEKRGLMIGTVMTGTGIGTMTLPSLARWLISTYDWRISFAVLGIIMMAIITITAQFIKRQDNETSLKSKAPVKPISGVSFREALLRPQLWVAFGIFMCIGYTIFAVMTHIVIHAIDLNFSGASALSIMVVAGGINIPTRLLMGSVSDRIGCRWTMVIGMLPMAAALFWLLLAKELWMFYLFAVMFGFAWGTSYMLGGPMIAELFGLKSHGVLMGVLEVGFATGSVLGPVVTGYIYDVTGSYQQAFLTGGIVGLGGIMLAFALVKTKLVKWECIQ